MGQEKLENLKSFFYFIERNLPEIPLSLEKLDYEILDAPIKILKYYSCKSIIIVC